jgi:hypothetical protein
VQFVASVGDQSDCIAATHSYDHLNDRAEKRYRWQRGPVRQQASRTPISLLGYCQYYPAAMFSS